MDFVSVLQEAGMRSLKLGINILLILLPLMIIFEILIYTKALDKLAKKMSFVSKWFEMSDKASFPLIVGYLIGLSYGAGVLYKYEEKKLISKEEFNKVSSSLCLCHAMIEDNMIFAVIGANYLVLLFVRLFLGIFLIKFFILLGKIHPRLNILFGDKNET